MSIENKIILRNESFGGIYFNQTIGRTVMIDPDGFLVLLNHLQKRPLSDSQEKFSKFFFNPRTPLRTKILFDKSISFQNNNALVTHSPVLIDLSLSNACNLNCPYCYMSTKSLENGEYLSMNDFETILSEMTKNRVLQVALGGGEPTFHPHFPEILKKIRVEGDIIPNYTTNGTNLTPEILKATKKYCGAVAVSYSEERERENERAVNTLIKNGIQTNLHIVLLKSRVHRLSEITKNFAKLGISSVVLLLFKPIGRGSNLEREVVGLSDKKIISTELVKILLLRKKYSVRLSIDACSAFLVKDLPFLPESIDGCTGATYSCYIDWKLRVKPCSFMQDEAGIDLKGTSLKDAWNSPSFNQFRSELLSPRFEGCEECESFTSCWGGCMVKPDLVACESRLKAKRKDE